MLDADGKENGIDRKGSLSVGAKLLSVALLLSLIVGVVAMIAGRSKYGEGDVELGAENNNAILPTIEA